MRKKEKQAIIAELEQRYQGIGTAPVSYTHLDVYKRQVATNLTDFVSCET